VVDIPCPFLFFIFYIVLSMTQGACELLEYFVAVSIHRTSSSIAVVVSFCWLNLFSCRGLARDLDPSLRIGFQDRRTTRKFSL
jgi:hypothetical protein